MTLGQIAGISVAVIALIWMIAAIIAVLDSRLPHSGGAETGWQWLKRFRAAYPGPKTWIVIYGLYFWVVVLSVWSLIIVATH